MKLKELYANYQNLLDTKVVVNGFVLTIHSQKDITFIKLTNGSNA